MSRIDDTIDRIHSFVSSIQVSPWQIGGAVVGSFVLYEVAQGVKHMLIEPYFSPLKALPGPEKVDNYLLGHLLRIINSPPATVQEEWRTQYGPVVGYRGLLMSRRCSTSDPKAVAYILNRAYDFPKPEDVREALASMFGKGVLFAEGEDHKRQRKLMNPCFGPAQIRDLMPVFYDKAFKLRDIWMHQLEDSPSEGKIVDVFPSLIRATLDVIGSAGFDYEFNALDEQDNELMNAFMALFAPMETPSFFAFLQGRYSILKIFPNHQAQIIKHSRQVILRIGSQLIADKKKAHEAFASEKGSTGARDLLSVLVKANMAAGVSDADRLTDEEMVDQISTMLIAGHETTGTSIAWLLYDLAKPEYQHVQDKLRAELQSIASDQPSMDELNALPYLDAVIRENLRKNAVVSSTVRCAAKEEVVPLGQPYVDTYGVERTEFTLGKGENVVIPILAMNRDKAIWGEDAMEFKPERWLAGDNSHPRSAEIPGVFAGVLSFLGGPRACIGYRLALLEMKAIVFALVRNFSYDLSDPELKIEAKVMIVARPAVKQPDGTLKNSLPLRVTPVRAQ